MPVHDIVRAEPGPVKPVPFAALPHDLAADPPRSADHKSPHAQAFQKRKPAVTPNSHGRPI